MTWTDLKVGAEFASAAFGPFTVVDTVRWAGVQENDERIHFDRDFAREKLGLMSFIVSGGHRQALLARVLTDLAGPRGRLTKLHVRHTAPTFDGDTLCYSTRVKNVVHRSGCVEISCEIEGKNQRNEQVLIGDCVLRADADTP